MFTPNGTDGGVGTVAGTGAHSTRRRYLAWPLSSVPCHPRLLWHWRLRLKRRRLIRVVLADLDPLRVSVGIGKLMLAGGLVVLLDDAHVPLLVYWPEDAYALPDHAVGAESFRGNYCLFASVGSNNWCMCI